MFQSIQSPRPRNACMDYTLVEDIKTYETVLSRLGSGREVLRLPDGGIVPAVNAGAGPPATAVAATDAELYFLSQNTVYFGTTTSRTWTTSAR